MLKQVHLLINSKDIIVLNNVQKNLVSEKKYGQVVNECRLLKIRENELKAEKVELKDTIFKISEFKDIERVKTKSINCPLGDIIIPRGAQIELENPELLEKARHISKNVILFYLTVVKHGTSSTKHRFFCKKIVVFENFC